MAPGSVGLHVIDGLPLPNEQVFTSMLDGWPNQQLARNLAFSTIEGRPVVAAALGCHHNSTPNIAAVARSPWSGYAPRNHDQPTKAGHQNTDEYRPVESRPLPVIHPIFTVHELKRLARNAAELMTLSAELQAGGIQLELLTGPLGGIYDPNGMGAMFFAILAVTG